LTVAVTGPTGGPDRGELLGRPATTSAPPRRAAARPYVGARVLS